ncbi:hypothetical protein Leryth_014764 [Lithospermum erythrorhizon]|nr:hypothetical protein Leryth_014764 [Lithospermum erythrorhizon]
MGYLLKEALKTLCGVNQWSYAVFWKIGFQNPKLLIWEECYYEPVSYSNVPRIPGVVNPDMGFDNWDAWVSAEAGTSHLQVSTGNKTHLLVNKMMMENHVNIMGEGLVGRAAFTGNHQWVLSDKFTCELHPQEVIKEVRQQFSAGMQTVAVIPVLPHGVVQLGSCFNIMENLAFVNDVKGLVLQLGCVPGILLSDSYRAEENMPKIGLPVYGGNDVPVNSSTSAHFTGSINYQVTPTHTAGFVSQTSCSPSISTDDILRSSGTPLNSLDIYTHLNRGSNGYSQEHGVTTKTNLHSVFQPPNGVTQAEMIHSTPDVWLKSSFDNQHSTFQDQSSINSILTSGESFKLLEERLLSDAGFQNHTDHRLNLSAGFMATPLSATSHLVSSSSKRSATTPSVQVGEVFKDVNTHLNSSQDVNVPYKKNVPSLNPARNEFYDASKTKQSVPCMMNNLIKHLQSDHHSSDNTAVKSEPMKEGAQDGLFEAISIPVAQEGEHMSASKNISNFGPSDDKVFAHGITLRNSHYEDACMQPFPGDDLFDILGVDFKNKLLNGSWNGTASNGSESSGQKFNKKMSTPWLGKDAEGTTSNLYSVSQGNTESGIFSSTVSDHLLDAVVSKLHPSPKQSLDDTVSCKTTLTEMSSTVPATSRSYGRNINSDQMQADIFGIPNTLLKAGSLSSCSFVSGASKDNAGTNSPSSSMYGSQLSSWVEHSRETKQSSSASTAYSKKADEMSKTNRKRLKPGENPRPRPKDRQMIQDRVKELREIVPNGIKCSIDALLERTIKHMLFLQSVTKHADKLKQTGEPKVLSREGGLLLKDNFEGGATWAYEVGSQSMVCPIIVEDLNQPRQMLVEVFIKSRLMLHMLRGSG